MASTDSAQREIPASKFSRYFQADRIGCALIFTGAFAFHLAVLFNLLPA